MTLIDWLHALDMEGYVLLPDSVALPLLRHGVIARMRGTTMNYHLAPCGRSLLATMRKVKA